MNAPDISSARWRLRRLAFLRAAIAAIIACTGTVTSAVAQTAAWRLTAPIRVGADDNLTRVLSIIPLADGGAFIVDAGDQEITRFASNGARVSPIGRTGRGPGEFVRISSAGLLGDTLWVIDLGEPRATLFSRDGKVLSTIQRSIGSAPMLALTPHGALGRTISAAARSANNPRIEQYALVSMDRRGDTQDTLSWLSTKNANFALQRADGNYTIGSQLFSDADTTIVAPTGEIFFVVQRPAPQEGNDATFTTHAIRANGDTIWTKTFKYAPRRAANDSDSAIVSLTKVLERAGHNSASIRSALFVPEYLPPITGGFAGLDGSLWLRREGVGSSVGYVVINAQGRLVAALTVASNLKLVAATSSYVWAVHLDRDDVPVVTRYRITR